MTTPQQDAILLAHSLDRLWQELRVATESPEFRIALGNAECHLKNLSAESPNFAYHVTRNKVFQEIHRQMPTDTPLRRICKTVAEDFFKRALEL